ncbi:MAG: hypothetical protein A2234_07535 [Elusimicrobia bacterium RIFOXYA2_FULL_58_8]|nr:MAG: hypothetical protein A2234_07535 [Elusimicrobia bacterium RIFOXYA2_FULL_58_8]OGS13721.1 MAG: hypothetical protein A2285_01300 [Elusimicrobia bacterium RIFOXYA12_FULL_57_11]
MISIFYLYKNKIFLFYAAASPLKRAKIPIRQENANNTPAWMPPTGKLACVRNLYTYPAQVKNTKISLPY